MWFAALRRYSVTVWNRLLSLLSRIWVILQHTAGCWSFGLALCRAGGSSGGLSVNKEGVYNFTIGMTLSKNERAGCSTMSRSSLVYSNIFIIGVWHLVVHFYRRG